MIAKYLNNRSINQVNLIGILFSSFMILLFSMAIAYNEYLKFEKESKKLRDEYIKSQKELIVQETNRALRFIEYKYNQQKENPEENPEDEAQNEVIEAIEQMRDQRDGTGYVFIYTFDGICIADPILEQNKGRNLIDFEDPDGKKVIKDLIDVAKEVDGGFVEYIWNKPIINELAPKISYAKSFEPWGWMVGSGVYLDSINEIIKEKDSEYKEETTKIILQILGVGAFLFFVIFYLSKLIANVVSRETEMFVDFFSRAANKREFINVKALNLKEFKEISKNANKMLKQVNKSRDALEILNSTLEQKVEEKTKKLQAQNLELQSVLEAQDKFLKNAIHEVFTPIGIIYANIDLIELKIGRTRYLDKIEAAAKTIHNIYSDLSYIIKKDRGVYKKNRVDFSKFLKNRIEYFKELASGNDVHIVGKIEKNLEIYFNQNELERVVDNNISNAIKYSFQQSKIEISLKKIKEDSREDKIELKIVNRGKTIENPDRLFERFYREDEARGGFGLGLNIIKEICDKNSVNISVKSENGKNVFIYHFHRAEESEILLA